MSEEIYGEEWFVIGKGKKIKHKKRKEVILVIKKKFNERFLLLQKLDSVSKNADLRFMLYIKNNLWGFDKRYNEI